MRGHFWDVQGYLWSPLVLLGGAGETGKFARASNQLGLDRRDPASDALVGP